MSFAALPERLAQVRAEIARQQAAGGWTHAVTIVAVTKGFGPEAVIAALAAGLADIGENRVQEALDKLEKMDRVAAQGIRWHLIGHLQRNKAKLVPGRFAVVHSVDSLELAEELNRRSSQPLRVLLQVNVAREPQKSGCTPEEAPGLARQIAGLGQLQLDGLMTMAPFTDDEDVQRRTFRSLRALRDTIKEDGVWLPTLSMGMSADYATAVAEGATVIRLGTVLFGPRGTETTP
jgi:PLP dependent protein